MAPMVALGLALSLACSGGDAPATPPESTATPPIQEAGAAADAVGGDGAAVFASDPDLVALVSATALGLPARFVEVPRTDREPILTLGLVTAAARITYSSATTNEILSLDVLRLEPQVDTDNFFDAFADSLADEQSFLGVRMVGVLRDIGERARHVRFTVQGDEGEAVAVLRNGMIALATYRHPAGLREVVDMGALLARMDTSLRGDG